MTAALGGLQRFWFAVWRGKASLGTSLPGNWQHVGPAR